MTVMTGALFQHFYEEKNKLVAGALLIRPFAGRRPEKFASAPALDRLPSQK